MPGKNTYLSISNFNDLGNFDSFNLECTINDVCYRKGDTLESNDIKKVLENCKKYNGLNVSTIVVKNHDKLTIWIEKKGQENRINSVPSQKKATNPTPAQPQVNSKNLPTKTITKRYRGQVYEETVVDWSAVQQTSEQNKHRRKYRGQYID